MRRLDRAEELNKKTELKVLDNTYSCEAKEILKYDIELEQVNMRLAKIEAKTVRLILLSKKWQRQKKFLGRKVSKNGL